MLWPETDPATAFRNLSNLLYRLKKILGHGWLESDADSITLRTSPDLWVDVHIFDRLTSSNDPDALQRAIALYRADLLPNLYDDWIILPREQLREKYLACLLEVGEITEASDQLQVAILHYRQLLAADPLHEEAARGLMRCLGKTGRFTDALDVYERLRQKLQAEIAASPGLDTRLLADQLRSEAELAIQVTARPTPARFVGRVTERARLLALLDRARQGQGGMVVILGEAGIGKTRLSKELENAAIWRGWQIVWGQADEFSLPRPYAPLTHALEQALPPARVEMLARSVPAISLSIVASLVPGLPAPAALPESLATDQLAHALQNVLRALQALSPHLLVLDDVQWADPALWLLLERLYPALQEMAILLVINARPAEIQNQPSAWETIQTWDHQGVPVIHLEGLATSELSELAAPWGLAADQLEHLAEATGGNPLFSLQLLQSEDLEANLEGNPTLADLALHRVANLSALAQYCVQIAAVIGIRFDYSTWEAVLARVNVPIDQLPALAGEVERARVLSLDREGYRFAHDTLRAAVYTQLSEAVRRQFHRQILAVLEERAPSRTLDLLYHAERGKVREAIARFGHRAGEEALASFVFPAAVRYFSTAYQALPHEYLSTRYEVVRGRQHALNILSEREAQRADLELLQELANQLADVHKQAESFYLAATFYYATGDYEEGLAVAEQGLALARQVGDKGLEAAVLELLARIVRDQGQLPLGQTRMAQAREIHQRLGNQTGLGTTTDLLGGLAWEMGDYQEAARWHAEAASLFEGLNDPFRHSQALNNLGSALWGLGDYARARLTHQQALAICRELGDQRGIGDNLDNLGGVAWVEGDFTTAIDFYRQALAIRQGTDDLWGVVISLNNLGDTYRLIGEWETALKYFAEADDKNRTLGLRRLDSAIEHGRGLIFLETGKLDQAQAALENALAIRGELKKRDGQLDTNSALALLWLARGDPAQAQASIQDALRELSETKDQAALRQRVHFSAFRVFAAQDQPQRALEHLHRAARAMDEMAVTLLPEARPQFLENVPLNRQVRTALESFSRVIQRQLVRAGVPRGKKLTGDDYVTVAWTVSTLQDSQFAPDSARRQHVLRRLLAEAAAQGAAPTDQDLAQALGVSRRTVLRDIQVLEHQGEQVKTRQRDSAAG